MRRHSAHVGGITHAGTKRRMARHTEPRLTLARRGQKNPLETRTDTADTGP